MDLSETTSPHRGITILSETAPTSYFDDAYASREVDYINNKVPGNGADHYPELGEVNLPGGKYGPSLYAHQESLEHRCLCSKPECIDRSLEAVFPFPSSNGELGSDIDYLIISSTNSERSFLNNEKLDHYEPQPNRVSMRREPPIRNVMLPTDRTPCNEQGESREKDQFQNSPFSRDIQLLERQVDNVHQKSWDLSKQPEENIGNITLAIDRVNHSTQMDIQSQLGNTCHIPSMARPQVSQILPGLTKAVQDLTHSPHDKIYSCTYRICSTSFKRKDHWKRHERDIHWDDKYICMECNAVITDPLKRPTCGFCFVAFPNDDAVKEHILNCDDALIAVNRFQQRDQLVEHLRKKHDIQNGDNMLHDVNKWFYCFETKWPKQCGFCGEEFNSWNKRGDHVAKHFKEGKLISEWTLPFAQKTKAKDLEPKTSHNIHDGKSGRSDDISHFSNHNEGLTPQTEGTIAISNLKVQSYIKRYDHGKDSDIEMEEYRLNLSSDNSLNGRSTYGLKPLKELQRPHTATVPSLTGTFTVDEGDVQEISAAFESAFSISPALERFLSEGPRDEPITTLAIKAMQRSAKAQTGIPNLSILVKQNGLNHELCLEPTILGKRKRYKGTPLLASSYIFANVNRTRKILREQAVWDYSPRRTLVPGQVSEDVKVPGS
ncbi:hypothetical protein B7463_g12359, partial [Scytalidium lignicola]